MALNYKDILKKAEESQAEKIAAEKERARLEQEEKERKEREVREEAERKEREAREAEEKRRAEEEERKRQEQIEAERKRQEQKAAEERKRAEEEERRRQEEQRLLDEKNARTQNYIIQLALLNPRMQDTLKKDKKASESELKRIISEFESLTNQDVFLYNFPTYSEACNAYNSLKILLVQKTQNKKKKQKTMKRIRITFVAVLAAGLIGGAVFGIYKYTSSEEYIAKAAEKKSQKEAAAQAKAAEKKSQKEAAAQAKAAAAQAKEAEKAHQKLLKSYKVGNWGEAGVIFYDKGEYSDGWRFLEIAPTKSQNRYFGIYSVDVEGLKTELGTGDINTELLVEVFEKDSAAYYAATYSSGGKDDWYLGNVAEMKMCYKNLVDAGKNKKKIDKLVELGKIEKFYSTYWEWNDAGTICYLTSEQKDQSHCYTLCFSASSFTLDGGKPMAPENTWEAFSHSYIKGYTNYVRPIRKF